MIQRTIRRPVLAATALLAAAWGGCTDATGPTGDVGTVSFDYAGAEAGRFSVVGARPADWATRPHAAGQRLEEEGIVSVFAYNGGRQVFLDGRLTGPGTYPFSEARDDGTFGGEFALGVDSSRNTARAIYVLVSGSLTLDPSTDGRIRGRFAGTARALNGTAVVEIRDGEFDVPDNLPPPVF